MDPDGLSLHAERQAFQVLEVGVDRRHSAAAAAAAVAALAHRLRRPTQTDASVLRRHDFADADRRQEVDAVLVVDDQATLLLLLALELLLFQSLLSLQD